MSPNNFVAPPRRFQSAPQGELLPLRAGESLSAETFAGIRNHLLLDFCKWDPQVGDVSTLADFPLLLQTETWRTLASMAEALTAETFAAETELLERPELLAELGLPRNLRKSIESSARLGPTRAAARVMRFDFHPTTEGWRISEVNSDVPGGFTEASHFTRLMAAHCAPYEMPGDPLAALCKAISESAENGIVALLTAPGFMEDHQIMACLRDQLVARGCKCYLAGPMQIKWLSGRANLSSRGHRGPLDGIVRFHQAEWFEQLPTHNGWSNFFSGGNTPVANPGQGIIAESKRFPLIWNQLATQMPAWRELLPPTCDPREASLEREDGWLLKSAFCNTGDTVCMRSLMDSRQWNVAVREARRNPLGWVAQRQFESLKIMTPRGAMFPCIGIYTVNGSACGVYARLAARPVVDFEAVDVALLLDTSMEDNDV